MIFATLGRTDLRLKPWFRDMFDKLEIMCDGEVGQFDNRYNLDITEEKCLENIIGKTSAMFEIACNAGAFESKCNEKEKDSICRFARNFGLLFQLRDDLMDFIATSDESKKTIHNDFWSGYYTFPAIHTFANEKTGKELKNIAKDLANGIHKPNVDERITELIREADGFKYTVDYIEKYKNLAIRSLDCFKDSLAKKKLVELVEYLWKSIEKLPI